MQHLGLLLASLLGFTCAVKKQDFRRCDQIGFCQRARDRFPEDNNHWIVDEQTFKYDKRKSRLLFDLGKDHVKLSATLSILEDGMMFRLQIDESRGSERYRIPKGDVVSTDLDHYKDLFIEQLPQKAGKKCLLNSGGVAVHLNFRPFHLSISKDDEELLALNSDELFNVESEDVPSNTKAKEDSMSEDNPSEGEDVDRRFGSHYDTMPSGRRSLSCDISFGPSEQIYGLAEHTTGMALKDTILVSQGNVTVIDEPYRLYNLDVFEYELDSTMALYGAVPWVMAKRAGIFWNNPSETWCDVVKFADRKGKNILMSSESGIIDLFLVLGLSPKELLTKFAMITGYPAMPPMFSLGYHQCRWNYKSQADLLDVHAGFDEHEMPVDVLWLDIEHTDGKRYFTWDDKMFPDPEKMQRELDRKGRKLVTIVDPHIKADEEYSVYKAVVDKRAVLDKNGQPFHGHCWPGDSVWPDFADPKVRQWWAGLYSTYPKMVPSVLHIWNDMNEPSVFNGPEITMPKDNLHLGGAVEHRDLHNLYGQYQHRATYEGLLARSKGTERPFVLSRAFYAGSQKYGAIWTGDNMAKWDHLAASIPMLLSLSLSGMPFVGADVGGFFGNPEPELMVRWYQTGALYPFFRGHAHIDTERREPWLLKEPYRSHVREALRLRYQLLSYIYTLFFEATFSGVPLMRPLFLEFPEDESLSAIDDQFMLGSALMHKPVTSKDQHNLSVAIPNGTIWYDYWTLDRVQDTKMDVELSTIPLFIAGGSILPVKMRPRRSSKAMLKDPFTLIVALDTKQEAKGTVYVDDGKSFEYEEGAAYYQRLQFADGKLSCQPADSYTLGMKHLDERAVSTKIEAIVITGLQGEAPKGASVVQGKVTKSLTIESDEAHLVRIRLPPVSLSSHWTIQLDF